MKKTVLLFLCLFLFKIGFSQPSCIQVDCIPPNGSSARGCALCGPTHHSATSNTAPVIWGTDPLPCGTIDNNYFVLFTADSTGNLSVTALTSSCQNGNGIEMIVYDQLFNPISNCFSSNGINQAGTVNATGLTPGADYWIMIDGYNGDQCEVILAISGAFLEGPPAPPGAMTIGSTSPCVGGIVCYSIDAVPNASSYEWVIPGNSVIVSGGGTEDLEVCVEYTAFGGGVVRVTPSNRCFPGIPAITPVVVVINTSEASLDTAICPGDVFEFHGRTFSSATMTQITIADTTVTDCDSVLLRLNLIVSDLTAPEIFCGIDSFLNKMNIRWTAPLGASGYELFLDDSLISVQPFNSYLFQDFPTQDSITLRVVPFNGNNCNFESAEHTCVVIRNTTNIKEDSNDLKLSLFPNPTNDFIEIQTDFLIEKVGVFDLAGKLLFEDFDRKVDLSSYEAGIYFFKIKTANGLAVEKVIKL